MGKERRRKLPLLPKGANQEEGEGGKTTTVRILIGLSHSIFAMEVCSDVKRFWDGVDCCVDRMHRVVGRGTGKSW